MGEPIVTGRLTASSDVGVTTELIDSASALLRSVRMKRTPGRLLMLAVLMEADPCHLAMATFRKADLVHSVPGPTGIAFGLVRPAHVHAVCSVCGAVTNLPAERFADVLGTAAAVAAVAGFQVAGGGLSLHGRCRRCFTAGG